MTLFLFRITQVRQVTMFHVQEKRQDREIENLFQTLQSTIELRDSSLERCRNLADTHLAELKHNLEVTRSLVEQTTADQEKTKSDWVRLSFMFSSSEEAFHSIRLMQNSVMIT